MRIFFFLVGLFIMVPVIELIVLFRIAGSFGTLNALALIITTGIIGAHLARQQGIKVVQKIRNELKHGRLPGFEMIEGLIILIAAVVLITPGLLTDLIGFSLLLPSIRRSIYSLVVNRFKKNIRSSRIRFHSETDFNRTYGEKKNDDVIEVEFKDLDK